jgi:predicted nucleic-acid-binding Zn-ribbon protein
MSEPCRCGATEVFFIDTVTTPNTEYANTVNPLAVISRWVQTGKGGFFGLGGERESCGLSAAVCTACGRVEWYAKDLAMLARIADSGERLVRRTKR